MAINNFDNSNSKSKPKPPKFINFLLLIDQDITNDL